MKITVLLAILFIACAVGAAPRPTRNAADLTGTWSFSVDLDDGGHGDPTFVFKQDKDVLTGSYDGPLGQHTVTGTVTDNKAVFGFEFTNEGETHKVTYNGTLEERTRMTGTMAISDGPTGKWTANRK